MQMLTFGSLEKDWFSAGWTHPYLYASTDPLSVLLIGCCVAIDRVNMTSIAESIGIDHVIFTHQISLQ